MPVRKSAIAVAVFLTFGAFSFARGQDQAPRSGEAVFDAACAKCHTGGIGGFFSGGPTVGKKSDWEALAPRGVDGLTGTTLSGIGKMAARGGCTSCSDAEIRAAVAYMLEKSR
jgi:cytochrome c5